MIVVAAGGDGSANYLLILSQVVISFSLPFAVIPLVHISSSSCYMGVHVNTLSTRIIAILIAILIVVLNLLLLITS